jgi:hypothetical protein
MCFAFWRAPQFGVKKIWRLMDAACVQWRCWHCLDQATLAEDVEGERAVWRWLRHTLCGINTSANRKYHHISTDRYCYCLADLNKSARYSFHICTRLHS